MAELVLHCLSREPLARPTASDVLRVLQTTASADTWWPNGRLQTVPEVSESGIRTENSRSSKTHSSRSRGEGLATDTSRIQSNHSSAASSKNTLSSGERRQQSLSASLRRCSENLDTLVSEILDTEPDLRMRALPVGSTVGSDSPGAAKSSISGDSGEGGTGQSIAAQLDPVLQQAPVLVTDEEELQQISEVADAMLQSSKATPDLLETPPQGAAVVVKAPPVLLPPRSLRPDEDIMSDSQPSQALSDDMLGKERMADKTFAELQVKPAVILGTINRFSREDIPRMALNQHDAPRYSWEKSSQEQSSFEHSTQEKSSLEHSTREKAGSGGI